jgi:hypothetical protein
MLRTSIVKWENERERERERRKGGEDVHGHVERAVRALADRRSRHDVHGPLHALGEQHEHIAQ